MLYKKLFPDLKTKIEYRSNGKPKKNFDAEVVARLIEQHEKKNDNRDQNTT